MSEDVVIGTCYLKEVDKVCGIMEQKADEQIDASLYNQQQEAERTLEETTNYKKVDEKRFKELLKEAGYKTYIGLIVDKTENCKCEEVRRYAQTCEPMVRRALLAIIEED